MPVAGSAIARHRPMSPATLALFMVLGLWLALPFLQHGMLAEDAIPFVTAGQLVVDEPEAVYPQPVSDTSWSLHPRFAEQGCANLPPGEDCSKYVVPFISTPTALSIAWGSSLPGVDVGVGLFRMVGALAAVGGVLFLRRRLDPVPGPTDTVLLLTALLITPLIYITLVFGQSSPLMFASAAMGLAGSDRRRNAALGALLWVPAVVLKLFPLALVPVALLQRRWRLLATSTVLLVVLTMVGTLLAPPSIWGDFVGSTRSIATTTVVIPENLSIDAVIHKVDQGWIATSSAFTASLAVRVVAMAAVFWWRLRRAPGDVQWAWAWVAIIAVQPQLWWHYDLVAVAALGVGVAAVPGPRGRNLWVLVVGAGATLPLALATSQRPLLVVSNVLLVGTLAYLAVRPGTHLEPATPEPVAPGSRQGAVEGGSVNA